jgi:hypothetical protein
MSETIYRIVKKPDATYAVEVTQPDQIHRAASSFKTMADAEAWIATDRHNALVRRS